MKGCLPQRLLPRPAVTHLSSPSPPHTSNGCSAPVWSWPGVSAEGKRDTGDDDTQKNKLWNKEIRMSYDVSWTFTELSINFASRQNHASQTTDD